MGLILNFVVSIFYSLIGLCILAVLGIVVLAAGDYFLHSNFVRDLLTIDIYAGYGK